MPTNPRLTRASMALSRRMFLKAIALGLSVPLAAKLARIASAAPTPAPKRFLLMYMPDGVPPEHFNPQVNASDPTNFALDQTGVSILGPLQQNYNSATSKYVNVYQGFKYTIGATHSGIVNCLSGVDTLDTTTPRTTLEQVIANGLGVKPLILGACAHQTYGLDSSAMLFWNGSSPIDPEKNPVTVADRLFGGATTTTPNADVQLRSDLLALTASEIQGLQSTLGGLTTEQTKLGAHLKAIQALQSGPTMSGASTCTTAPTWNFINQVRAGAAAAPPLDSSGGNDYFYDGANFPLLFQAQLELAAQSLICNAAQVVAVMPMWPVFELDFGFSQPGAAAPPQGWSHHQGLSHTGPQQAASNPPYNAPLSTSNLDPTARAPFAKAQLWFINQLTTLVLDKLRMTVDPSGSGESVLDNTLVFIMSEIGDGANHTTGSAIIYPQTPSFLPMVTIGKCGGGINAGNVFQIATPPTPTSNTLSPDRPAVDLYLSFAKAMGVPNATFPGSTGPVAGVAT